ncbi:MAG: type II toxin-antitoxin system Phd/YefM family antitoxin [Turicibacter sp.]|nr:type II toxin-antitoxin system Phd/YefM family antitoxin [Turicibacter sp.]
MEIRPFSDLRNNFSEISKIVHETNEPVFLTKIGYGDMVVMSIEQYERKRFEDEVYFKFKVAELEAITTDQRILYDEASTDMWEKINNASKVQRQFIADSPPRY